MPETNDHEHLATEVDRALAHLDGALDGPTVATTVRQYAAMLHEGDGVPMLVRATEGYRTMRLVLSIPGWANDEVGGARVGGLLDGKPFLSDGMDLEHDVVEHEETHEVRQCFTVTFAGSGLAHFHGIGPITHQLRETPRGPVLRMALEVVECKPPKGFVASLLEGLMGVLMEMTDPEDFQP